MKFENIDKNVLAELKIRMENEIADYMEEYCNDCDINIDSMTPEIFDEAMEDFYSEVWVNFLDQFNTEALYEATYNKIDGIVIDFEEV